MFCDSKRTVEYPYEWSVGPCGRGPCPWLLSLLLYNEVVFPHLYKLTACIFGKIVTKDPPHSLWCIRADKWKFYPWKPQIERKLLNTLLPNFQLCLFHKLFLLCNKVKLWKMAGTAHLVRNCVRLGFQTSRGTELSLPVFNFAFLLCFQDIIYFLKNSKMLWVKFAFIRDCTQVSWVSWPFSINYKAFLQVQYCYKGTGIGKNLTR